MSKIIIRNLAVLLLLSTGGYVAMAQPKTFHRKRWPALARPVRAKLVSVRPAVTAVRAKQSEKQCSGYSPDAFAAVRSICCPFSQPWRMRRFETKYVPTLNC